MATIYDPQSWLDARACDTEIPTGSGADGNPFDFAQDGSYAGGGNRWFVRCSGGPTGISQYMEVNSPTGTGPGTPGSSAFVVSRNITAQTVTEGEIWYMAVFFQIRLITGLNVHLHPSIASFDKTFDFEGTGLRYTWLTGLNGPMHIIPDGKYGLYNSNATFHLHVALECNDYYPNNVAPYNTPQYPTQPGESNPCSTVHTNPYNAEYDKWYAFVLELKVSQALAGWVKQYVNGVGVQTITNINTWAPGGMTIDRTQHGGTLGQPGYNLPNHYRRVAGWVITDNLSTLQARGYFSDPSISSSTIVIGQRRLIM